MSRPKKETKATASVAEMPPTPVSDSGMESSTLPTHLTPVVYTGRKPRVGDRCLYWFALSELTGGGLQARVADVVRLERGAVTANVQRIGSVYGRSGLQFSDTPRHNCLTWLDAQDE